MNTTKITLPLEDWLTMLPVIDRVLSAPYADIPGSVETARKLIRCTRLIEAARDDSGLEPITQSLAKQFGALDEKTQRYEFADKEGWAQYVAGRRAVLGSDVTIEVPLLSGGEIKAPMNTAERTIIAPLFGA